ncbi:MAG TPA: NADH-quinone oxidoreductase subunit M [Ktedonobacteraceae bacterium]|nr:NADH-quinone oxidoreductase subunit M [Ktedonobacteraceae bacterium]
MVTVFASPLTWVLLLPVLGALVTLILPERYARWGALVFAAGTFALVLGIFFSILASNGWLGFGNLNSPGMSVDVPWIRFSVNGLSFNIDYNLGVDGLGMSMVILNGLLSLLAVIGGWKKPRVKEYMALLLLLETGVMGVFISLDLFLFFLFWEFELGPMFLLIGIWGSETLKHGMPGRIYSAWKFLLYTFFGSIFMFAGILLVYFKTGGSTASMAYLAQHQVAGNISFLGITVGAQLLIFLLIFVAFAVKIPMFPFHTWLPDAHTDASTEVSVILAGVLLKMGAYGLIRICLSIAPAGMQAFAPWMAVIAAINIVYGAAICLAQTDMKRLIAYSSVSHMGVVLLGVAAAAGIGGTAFRMAAITGATVQMFSHGLITGMLFFCVGVIYDRAHTREIKVFGGVAKRMPLLATLFTFAGLASLGLPGLAGFIAEYMTFTSSYASWPVVTIISVFTMILTASYLLWMLKRVFYGPFNVKWDHLPDASVREAIPLFVLAALIVLVGVYPAVLINVITPTLQAVMHGFGVVLK